MATAPPHPAAPVRPASGAPRRGGLLIVLLVLGVSLLVIAPLVLSSMRQEVRSIRESPAVTVSVVAGESGYTPAEIVVPAGANVRIDFTNGDPAAPHDLQTFGQRRDVRVLAWPGESKSTVFKASDRPGRYTFLSTIRGQAEAGFAGTIVVQ
jgi:plastocyanin